MKDLRALPAEVVERLGRGTDRVSVAQRGQILEARLSRIEARKTDDGYASLSGYATIFDYAYDVAGGIAEGGWSETIARGACDKSLAESADVRCLFDHSGIPIARTKSGTMTLTNDGVGLLVDVPALDLRSHLASDLAVALERGDLDEMSFAFRVVRQEWDSRSENRMITELQLFDVSIVSFPANPATVVGLRSDATIPDVVTLSLDLAGAIATSLRTRV